MIGPKEVYALLNARGLCKSAWEQGFDLVVLNFKSGNDYIQRNAYVVIKLLEWVRDKIGPGAGKTPIIGASMGGLIVRYALAYMCSKGMNHNTRLFVSFDSPQQGAYIPLGLQFFLSYFSRYSGAERVRKQLAETLDSPAARQMLVYHYKWGGGENDKAQPDDLRIQLLKELEQLGSYPPPEIRKVAVANGSGEGKTLYKVYAGILSCRMLGANGWCTGLPEYNATGKDQIFQGLYCGGAIWTKHIGAALPYDACPGAKRDTNGFVASQLQKYGTNVEIIEKQDEHCFIPTVSALDGRGELAGYPNVNIKALETLRHFRSPFDRYIYCENNENHIFINDPINNFLKEEIGII